MSAAVAPITALLMSVSFLLTGNGLQGTLLPVRASLEAFSLIELGVLGSSYYVGFALGCLQGPGVVQRAGHIRTFTAMVAVASSIVLAHALILNPVVWWLLRAGTGFCFAVLFMVIESWLNEKSTNETRGRVFSIYTIINLTVVTLGQLMLTVGEPKEFPLFLWASILVSLAAVPVALTKAEAPRPITAARLRFRKLYERSPIGVVGCLVVGLTNGSFWALAPIYAETHGIATSGIAYFMSAAVIAGAMGQWPLGRMSDQVDRRRVIILACVAAASAGVGMVFFGAAWNHAVFVFVFLYGLFAFPLYALCVAHLNDFTKPEGYVEASSGLLFVFALGAITGPVIASAVMRVWSTDLLFVFTAVVHATMAGFALHRLGRRDPVPAGEKLAFADTLRVSQTVSNVDPMQIDPQTDAAARGSAAAPA